MNYKLYPQLKSAVSLKQKEKIQSLLQEGAPVDSFSPLDNRPPLLSSVYSRDPEIVKMIMEKGASVNLKRGNDDTALTLAAKLEEHAIVDILLMAEGLQNCHNKVKLSHLHIACMRNNVDVVKKLIHRKTDINAAVAKQSLHWPGFTALHFAVQFRCIETVEYLLSIGTDIAAIDARQLTPLHLADMQRSEQIIDMILQAHTSVVSNPKNLDGLSHFHIACTRNNPEMVKFFINKIGANPQDSIHGSGFFSCFTAIDMAIYYECPDIVRLLLLHGDCARSNFYHDIDRIESSFYTGNMELVNLLLTRRKWLQEKSTRVEDIPDLHFACMNYDIAASSNLLSKSRDSLNLLWNGMTPLHLAI